MNEKNRKNYCSSEARTKKLNSSRPLTAASNNNQQGYFLSTILILSLVIIIMTTALIYVTINQKRYFQANREKASARQVAEAGINYYLWHLAHNNEDYADGTEDICDPTCGPYVHDYKNASGEVVGTYSLVITPPETGQNYATVVATGQLTGSAERKIIEARLGIPSFARYGFLSTHDVWFGPDEDSYGPVHSNIGIRHQGEAFNGIVTASRETYTCSGCGASGIHPGVWCDDYPTCPLLHNGYSFPVPAVDFNKVTADLAQMKTDAQPPNGLYFPYLGSSYRGYHIVLNQTNFQLYRVNTTRCTATQQRCWVYTQADYLWASDSIASETLLGTYNFPANGIIFTEDNLWIEGTINNAQLTFASARFPDTASTNTNIVINNNLLYTNYDGRDKIGLIAQNFITLPRSSPNYLEIDAAMVSQHSYVEWHNYSGVKYQRIKVHGSMGTNGGLVWTWVGCSPDYVCSGYRETVTEYDDYLTFGPPPSFPTTGAYAILYWEEVP